MHPVSSKLEPVPPAPATRLISHSKRNRSIVTAANMGADPTKQPEDVAAVPSDGDVESGSSPVPVTWFRSVFFQATVTGICAFVAPGLYNAMQSTGAGGQQTPYLVM